MTRGCTTLDGDIRTRLTAKKLADLLSKAGFVTEVRKFSHDGGDYVHVLGEVDDFTLARIDAQSYQVDAICFSARRMQALASRVSAILTDLRIRHRFLLSSRHFRQSLYFHHRWPKERSVQPLSLYREGDDHLKTAE